MPGSKQYLINETTVEDSWRLFHIMAEFTIGFETLADFHPAVSIFGSTRVKPEDEVYQKAERIGGLLAENGFAVITGGGPGVMEAANKGAALAGGKSIGLNIQLPLEQKPNPYANVSLSFRYFFVRKVMFVGDVCQICHGFYHSSGWIWNDGRADGIDDPHPDPQDQAFPRNPCGDRLLERIPEMDEGGGFEGREDLYRRYGYLSDHR